MTVVFLNSKLSENKEAKTVVELLTGKLIPSSQVIEAIEKNPFDCKTQTLEKVKTLSNICISHEQIDIILKYCLENQDTVFTNYYISKEEDGFSFKELSKGCVVGYTDDTDLLSFIQNHCKEIKLLPDEFSGYKDLKQVPFCSLHGA